MEIHFPDIVHFLLFVQVQKYWFPEAEMKKRYPQIQAFFAVSSFNGEVSYVEFQTCILTHC